MHITAPTPCRSRPNLFVAPEGEHPSSGASRKRVAQAKLLCADCPVLLACRDEARATRATGVWGGETDTQRRATGARPKRTTPVRRAIAACGTEAGAQRHRRAGEPVCDSCASGAAEAHRRRLATRKTERPNTMPARASEILRLADQGIEPKAIARLLGLTKPTIYGHRRRIAAALGVPVDQVLDAARAAGILPPLPAAADLGADDLAVAA